MREMYVKWNAVTVGKDVNITVNLELTQQKSS